MSHQGQTTPSLRGVKRRSKTKKQISLGLFMKMENGWE